MTECREDSWLVATLFNSADVKALDAATVQRCVGDDDEVDVKNYYTDECLLENTHPQIHVLQLLSCDLVQFCCQMIRDF